MKVEVVKLTSFLIIVKNESILFNSLYYPKIYHFWNRMTKSPIQEEILQIYNFCKTNCVENERWPSYYRRRYLEFCSYLELLPSKHYEKILELGCGIGYQSAFLSKIATKVVATDLDDENLEAHAPGMQQARVLLNRLDVNNVDLVGCSAEELPFADDSFDLVYSSHVLEHIPDQKKALREIYRVLRPGGIHFCVVPTTTEKVYAFFNFYTYLAGRAYHHLVHKLFSKKEKSTITASNPSYQTLGKLASSQLKYFPFPAPHGHYKHYLDELRQWTPGNWKSVVEAGAPFKVIQQSTSQFNFLLSLLGSIAPNWGTAVHAFTRKLELKCGKWPIIRSLGINTVMICKVTDKKNLIEAE